MNKTRRPSKKVSLFQCLTSSVGSEWLPPADLALMRKHAEAGFPPATPHFGVAVVAVGKDAFLIEETGENYSKEYRKKIIDAYTAAGFSETMGGILAAAQRQRVGRLFIEPAGYVLERRKLAKLPPLGRRALKKREVRRLLETLQLLHEGFWPIEMLTNTLRPYFKKTKK